MQAPELDWLAQVVDRSPDGVVAVDRAHRCTLWSAGMERISGLGRGEVLGRRVSEVLPLLGDTGVDVEAMFLDALAGRTRRFPHCSFEVPATGRRGAFEAHCFPLRARGEIVAAAAIVREVTERIAAEQQLRETETRFRTMADQAPVLLWMSGTDSTCDFFNQSWLDFTGRTMDDEIGIGWAEGVHPEDLSRCLDTYIEAFNARVPFEMEYRLRRHDGVYRWVLDRGAPRFAPDGGFAGFIGSCVDITDRREMEDERAALVARLQAALDVRNEFISIASHELNTPLTSIKLHADRARRALGSGGELLDSAEARRIRRLAETTIEQIDRLARLVSDMLDVSRLMSGQILLDPCEVDLARLAADTVERYRAELAEAGCETFVDAPAPVTGAFDARRIEQVVVNLLKNAMKYAAGTPVHVSVRAAAGRAILVVRDEGPGVPPEARERIFGRFERAVPASHASGLGLGLAIAREIAEAHGGTLRLDAEAHGGATFLLELPLLSASAG